MSNSIIDFKELGKLIRVSREAYGYSRCQDLAEAIYSKTGLKVSERTLYNIESGIYPPKLEVFLAMQQTMPQLLNYKFLKPAFLSSKIADIQISGGSVDE